MLASYTNRNGGKMNGNVEIPESDVDLAKMAFWAPIATSNPDIPEGGLSDEAEAEFDQACRKVVAVWKNNPSPAAAPGA